MFQDGPNREPAGQLQEPADAVARREARVASHNRSNNVSAGITTSRAWATVAIHIGPRPESMGRPAVVVPRPLSSRQFQALSDSLFKVLFIFPFPSPFPIVVAPVAEDSLLGKPRTQGGNFRPARTGVWWGNNV